jgi:hypothetical protein
MSKIGVGVIGASPLRPGWAVTAHLPALLALSEYELRAVATSSEASAKAAGEAYGVPAYADPAAMIARADIDLVVVTVKLAHHHTLVAEAIAAGKMVMCEWPLGVDFEQTADLAKQVALAGVGNLIGLQARMAPSIRYARDLVVQGYVGEVLGTTMVASGIAWTSVSDSACLYVRRDEERHLAFRTDNACAGRTTIRRWRSRRYPFRERSAPLSRQARRHERGDQVNDAGSSGDRRRAGKRRGGLDFLSRRCLARRQFSLGDQREYGRSRTYVAARQSSGARADAARRTRRGYVGRATGNPA